MSEVRLQVKNLCKNFGITKAVQNVSFNVNKGEVHALIGENGSGKSTLTNMLTGIYSIGSGQFILDGKEIHPKNQVEANNEGVSIIVQELGTLSGLTVAENIFLGHEDQFVHFGIKNTNAMNKKATELLKQYGFDRIKAADMIDNYNFEDRKLVEIVKATYFDPKIVVIDETTTALSQEGREELYKHMERIRKSGNTVIFISHDLPEILDKSDTITILRDGVYIDTVKSKDVTEDDLKKLMVGREVTGDYYRADYGEKVSDEVVLSVKNVTVPGLIENVSFDLHKGEILGFGGLSESGMHEIGKAIFGASYDREGTVTLADIKEYIDDESINYLGTTTDVRPYYENCTVFVLPSYREGMPMSIMEAEATGRTIIATNVNGCRDAVVDGYNGFIIPRGDYEQMAEKAIWCIEHPEETEKMGRNARMFAEKHFNENEINERIIETLTERRKLRVE